MYRKQILSTQLRAIKIALRHPLKLHPSKTLPPKWIGFGNESSLVVKHILVGQVQFFCFSSTSHAYLFACIKLHLCLSTASHINHQQVRHSTSVFFIASYVYIYIYIYLTGGCIIPCLLFNTTESLVLNWILIQRGWDCPFWACMKMGCPVASTV